MFEAAIENDMCIKNPTRNVHPPVSTPSQRDAFTDIEIATILEYLTMQDDRLTELMIHTLLFTGLRRGELLGLMWDDIDFKDSMLRLRRAVSFGEGGELVTRTIQFLERIIAAIFRSRQNL